MLEIITPATSKALTTLSAVAAELGAIGSQEPLLAEFILRASATAETFCGPSFAKERVRQTVNDTWAGPIFAERYPVTSIVSLSVDGKVFDPSEVQVGLGGLLYRARGWGRSAVITYDAGYVLPGQTGRTLPYDVERVVIELVKNAWSMKDRDLSVRSEQIDNAFTFSYFGPTSVLGSITEPLAAYRSPVVV